MTRDFNNSGASDRFRGAVIFGRSSKILFGAIICGLMFEISAFGADKNDQYGTGNGNTKGASGRVDQQSSSNTGEVRVVSNIKTDVKELKSKRNIRIFYMHDNGAPIVHVRLAFRNSGAAYQSREKSGAAMFYANTVFKGCGKYSPASFRKAIADLASNIRCESTVDATTFSLTAPKVVLDDAAELLNLALVDPKFEKDKVKIIKDYLAGFLQDYSSDPAMIAIMQIIPSIIFKGHPYEKGLLGSAEDFAKLSVDDIKKFKDTYIVARNAEVCVFGDVSEEEAVSLVDRIFENVADGSEAPDNIPDVSPKLDGMQKKYYVHGSQSSVFFVLKFARPNSEDIAAASIVSTVLGGPILTKSKVLGILRGKLGYIYSGRVVNVNERHADCLVGFLLTDNSKVSKAIDALKNIVKDLRENGITQEELDFAKGYINGSTLVGLRTSGRMCDFYFNKMLKGGGVDSLHRYLKGINAVNLEEVREYCRNNFDENAIPFVVIGGNDSTADNKTSEDEMKSEKEQKGAPNVSK